MADQEHLQRFDWVVRAARTATFVCVAMAVASLLALTAVFVATMLEWPDWRAGVGFGIAVALVAGTLAWTFVLYGLVKVIVANEHHVASAAARLKRVETLSDDQGETVRKLLEVTSLSDEAKRLLYRDREIQAIRDAVREDIMRQDYQTANAIIDSAERNFGYVDEAKRLREEVEASRNESLDEKIDAAIERIKQIILDKDWARAIREAHRLIRLFPDREKVTHLPKRIEAARTNHKRELLQAYGEAVSRNDVDAGIDLLRQLDAYLTPQEAAALEESARGVFRAKLHNMGVEFALRVTEQQWDKALTTGREIIDEFPNSRMAQEVREKLPQLRSRAQQQATGQQS